MTFFRVLFGLPFTVVAAPFLLVGYLLVVLSMIFLDVMANLTIVSYDLSGQLFGIQTNNPENLIEKLRDRCICNNSLWDVSYRSRPGGNRPRGPEDACGGPGGVHPHPPPAR